MPAASHSVPSAAVPRARHIDGALVGDRIARPDVDLNNFNISTFQHQLFQKCKYFVKEKSLSKTHLDCEYAICIFFGGFDVLLNLRRYILKSICQEVNIEIWKSGNPIYFRQL